MAHGPSTSQAQVALVKVVATFQTHHRDLTGETGRFDPGTFNEWIPKIEDLKHVFPVKCCAIWDI